MLRDEKQRKEINKVRAFLAAQKLPSPLTMEEFKGLMDEVLGFDSGLGTDPGHIERDKHMLKMFKFFCAGYDYAEEEMLIGGDGNGKTY